MLVDERAIDVIRAPQELARGGAPVDVVVVDVPAEDRRAVCEEVRSYYRGRLATSPGGGLAAVGGSGTDVATSGASRFPETFAGYRSLPL